MAKVRLRPKARADLVGIWDYTKEKWSAEQADDYVAGFDAAFSRLAENPLSGPSADHVAAGYRKQVCGAHVIYYKVKAGSIDVVRILHGRMDAPAQLK